MFGFKKKSKEEKEQKKKKKEKDKLSKEELHRLSQLQSVYESTRSVKRRFSHQPSGDNDALSISQSMTSSPSSSTYNLPTYDVKRGNGDNSTRNTLPPTPLHEEFVKETVEENSFEKSLEADYDLIYDTADAPNDPGEYVDLHIPAIRPPDISKFPVKKTKLNKPPGGDFGFLLRKGISIERSVDYDGLSQEKKLQIVFAEPGSVDRRIGLLPGDCLIGVNDSPVEGLSREEIISVIRNSGDSVELTVRPVPELLELSLREKVVSTAGAVGRVDMREVIVQQASLRELSKQIDKVATVKGSFPLDSPEPTTQDAHKKVWVVFKEGFSGGFLLEHSANDGKCLVRLDYDGKEVEVHEDQLEMANPESLNKSENLASLRYVNDSSVIHCLRQRFGSNLIHTYAGQTLLLVNPMAAFSMYSEKVMQLFRGCKPDDLPPHVFSTAQNSLYSLQSTRQMQNICLLGKSGSGKSQAGKHIITYLLQSCAASQNDKSTNHNGLRQITVDCAVAQWSLLDAFTSSRTVQNTAASRCCQLTTLEFADSEAGPCTRVVGMHSQIFLLEKSRVVRRSEGEPNFNVFYQMLAGLSSADRRELLLDEIDQPNLFMTKLQQPEDYQQAQKNWDKLLKACEILDISEREWRAVCRILAVIYHLGAAGAVQSQQILPNQVSPYQFERARPAQKAAALLGCSLDKLNRCVFDYNLEESSHSGAHTQYSALQLLEGFVMGLYVEAVNLVTYLCNRSLSSSQRSMQTISILDSAGFQNPGGLTSNSSKTSASSYEDLCYNYAHERLAMLSHEYHFSSKKAKFEQENIRAEWLNDIESSPEDLVALLDKNSPLVSRPATSPMRDADSKGLLWVLDEEALTGREDSLMKRINAIYQHQKTQIKDRSKRILRRVSKSGTFALSHCCGSQLVHYNTRDWLKLCREYPTTKNAQILLGEVKEDNLSGLLADSNNAGQTLRRGGRHHMVTSFKQKSVSLQVKAQMDFLIDLLRRNAQLHFVYCLLPLPNAGLSDAADASSQSPNKSRDFMNVPLLRQQLAGFQILEIVRTYRQGFPDQISFRDFRRRFGGLVSQNHEDSFIMDEKEAIQKLMESLNLDTSSYKIGLSQVFLRQGVANQLEEQMNENMSGFLVNFQAHCRGYIARKKLEKLKIQHKAIRCIQRNAAKYLEMRNWSWWRLYVRVKPLLNVQRTEEELKNSAEMVEQLRAKVDKLEKEKVQYRAELNALQNKLSDIQSELQEEKASSLQSSNLLEDERELRIKAEREVEDLEGKLSNLQHRKRELEDDLLQAKTWQQQHMQSAQLYRADSSDDEVNSTSDSIYKDRYRRAMQEMDFLRKQMQTKEVELEEEYEKLKRTSDRKVADLEAETERLESDLSACKRRLGKAQSELADSRVQITENESKTNDLERKQKRFDSEMSRVLANQQEEAQLREKFQRERDTAVSERIILEQELQELRSQMEQETEKVDRLTSQVNELSGNYQGDSCALEHELMQLRKYKHATEPKIKEYEEELDDQAASIESLQQTKLRLEMNLEKLRQSHSKELEDRDLDLETMRSTNIKRIRQLEQQLEEEREERQRLIKEKREADRQLAEMLTKEPQRDKDVERKLKKDLKKTKTLLRDAHLMLEQFRNQPDEKALIKNLKDQIEEAELVKEATARSKRSMEKDLEDLQQQLEDLQKSKQEVDDKLIQANRERSELHSQLEDHEEEMSELMRKYKTLATQHANDVATMSAQSRELVDITDERDRLARDLQEVQGKLSAVETDQVNRNEFIRIESRCRELETKLDIETTTKNRLQSQLERLKEQFESFQDEKTALSSSETNEKDKNRRLQRQLRDLQQELEDAQIRAQDADKKRHEMKQRLEEAREDHQSTQNDLKLAMRRIQDLQSVIDEELQDDSDDGGNNVLSASDSDSEPVVNSSRFLTNRYQSLGGSAASNHSYGRSTNHYRESRGSELSGHSAGRYEGHLN